MPTIPLRFPSIWMVVKWSTSPHPPTPKKNSWNIPWYDKVLPVVDDLPSTRRLICFTNAMFLQGS